MDTDHTNHSVYDGFCYTCQQWLESQAEFEKRMALEWHRRAHQNDCCDCGKQP
jgi:hypothetical protein